MFSARSISLFVALSLAISSFAVHLKVRGDVTERMTGDGLGKVVIRVYHNGSLSFSTTSNSKGKYEVRFPNQGRFTVRFSYPGYASKSFMVDTRGPSWEGDNSKQHLYIGMTMVKRLEGFDLSLLEMPMGKARFDPATGFVRWNKVWNDRLLPKYDALISAYDHRLKEMEEDEEDPRLASFPAPRF